jgi:hypothetical protein
MHGENENLYAFGKVLNRMNLVSISETIGKKISERMAIGCNTRI